MGNSILASVGFEQRIIDNWVNHFRSSQEEICKPGSTYIKTQVYQEEEVDVVISHVGSKNFVQYGAKSENKIQSFSEMCPSNLAVTADHMVSYFGNEDIQIHCLDKLMFLDPANLKDFTVGTGAIIRKLGREDQKYLDDLNESCTEEEVDNTFIGLDELGAWGCFIDNRLVCAVSYADWGVYGDFGVLTHPDYRGKGLAKAVLSAGCKEAISVGKVPLYRCHITLFPSISTAISLGFLEYRSTFFRQEVLRFNAGYLRNDASSSLGN